MLPEHVGPIMSDLAQRFAFMGDLASCALVLERGVYKLRIDHAYDDPEIPPVKREEQDRSYHLTLRRIIRNNSVLYHPPAVRKYWNVVKSHFSYTSTALAVDALCDHQVRAAMHSTRFPYMVLGKLICVEEATGSESETITPFLILPFAPQEPLRAWERRHVRCDGKLPLERRVSPSSL